MSFLKRLLGSTDKDDRPEKAIDKPAAPPPAVPEPIKVTEVSPEELNRRLTDGDDILVVDLRQPWEYHAGHIPGAINIFLQHFTARANELPRDKPIVLQCWHGFTSLDAAGFLIQNGWSASLVDSLRGGMAGWVQVNGADALEKAQ